MNNDLVSIIIVNWNGIKWLPDCFKTLTQQAYKKYEIIFVDNASQDGSVQWVKMHYPNTKIILNRENLGFADANNVGYRKAKGKYILFLNNDTRVTKTFLIELVRAIQDPSIGGVQSKILLMDQPDTHDSIGAFLTPTGFLYHYGFGKKDKKEYDRQIDLYTAKGACMLLRKDVLNAVAIEGNIFDPNYFAYFEETDLCHRVWLAGYRIVYVYKSVIYHKMGATSSGMKNDLIQYHSFKNRIQTYIKNFGTKWLWTILPFHLALCELYAMIAFVQGNWKLMWAIERALVWNIMNIVRSLTIRYYIQSNIRTISDNKLSHNVLKQPALTYYTNLLKGEISE